MTPDVNTVCLTEQERARFDRYCFPVPESGCWLWDGPYAEREYGLFCFRGMTILAHRLSYVLAKGMILAGLTIDHLCRVHSCVNPDHLEVVSQRVNVLRGNSPMAVNSKKTHCPRGHKFSPENIKRNPHGRQCRICFNAWRLQYYFDHRERYRDYLVAYRAKNREELSRKAKERYLEKKLKNGVANVSTHP